jgi:outer membrane protein assembly factor BamB
MICLGDSNGGGFEFETQVVYLKFPQVEGWPRVDSDVPDAAICKLSAFRLTEKSSNVAIAITSKVNCVGSFATEMLAKQIPRRSSNMKPAGDNSLSRLPSMRMNQFQSGTGEVRPVPPSSRMFRAGWGMVWVLAVMLAATVGCGDQSTQLAAAGAAPTKKAPGKSATKDSAWPLFRGPTGMGTSAAKGLPVTWGDSENIVWKVDLPGPGASSPIVFNDRIYLTSYSGFFVPDSSGGDQKDLKRHLIALRRTDGGVIWDKTVAAKLPEENQIRDHGFAANTPAADADGVYVFHGKTGVFAYDHDGKQIWQADVGSKTHGWGTSASPVIYKDLLFINASVESDSLVALNRKTGKEKWRAKGILESWNTPVVITAKSGRTELIIAKQGKVLAFNPDTGAPLWSCDTDIGWYMVPQHCRG